MENLRNIPEEKWKTLSTKYLFFDVDHQLETDYIQGMSGGIYFCLFNISYFIYNDANAIAPEIKAHVSIIEKIRKLFIN